MCAPHTILAQLTLRTAHYVRYNVTYVLFPPDLPKGEGGKSTSVSGGARSPTPPRGY